MKSKAYPKYKPSGVEWLGDVPEHWGVKKLKYISSIRYGIGEPPEYVDDGVPLIRATNVNAGKIETNNLVKVDPKDIPYSRIVWLRCGDIIVVRSGAYTGDSSIIPEEYSGAIAGFDMVLSCTSSYSKFISYGLLSKYLKDGQIYLQKLRAAQPHLNAEELGECLVILPPLPEQQAIAAFLDRETGRIDSLIARKQRLLELLAEQRTALISCAVTKGLDATVKLKPSGVEWLGDVPEHWEIWKLAHLTTRIGSGKTPTGGADVYQTEGVLFLRSQNVYDDGLYLDDAVYIDEKIDEEMAWSRVKPKDILLNITGASLGRTCITPEDIGRANVNQHVCVIRLNKSEYANFIAQYLKSRPAKSFYDFVQTGSAREGLNFEQIGAFPIPLPPLPEQQAIAAFLDRETAKIDKLFANVTTVIDRLKEYRTALISSAVTGKIDVSTELNTGVSNIINTGISNTLNTSAREAL